MTDVEVTQRRKTTQMAHILRTFKQFNEVDAHDMLIMFGISRTAGYIWHLRQLWGEDSIETLKRPAESMALYRLTRRPATFDIPRKPRRSKRGTWTCTSCGQDQLGFDGLEKRTPTLAIGECPTCGNSRLFRAL